jgi:hypothetical protein
MTRRLPIRCRCSERPRRPSDPGQLRHTQGRHHSPLACHASSLPPPIDTNQRFLAQSRRTLLCHSDGKADSPRYTPQRARTGNHHQAVSRPHQRITQALHLDQNRRRNLRHGRPLLLAALGRDTRAVRHSLRSRRATAIIAKPSMLAGINMRQHARHRTPLSMTTMLPHVRPRTINLAPCIAFCTHAGLFLQLLMKVPYIQIELLPAVQPHNFFHRVHRHTLVTGLGLAPIHQPRVALGLQPLPPSAALSGRSPYDLGRSHHK